MRAVHLAVIASTAFSALSVVIFSVYLVARFVIASTTQDFLRQVIVAGIVAGGVAQVLQFVTVALILVTWFSLKAMPKSRREMIILFLSLIPFVPVIILLVVAILYVRAHIVKLAPERRKELEATQVDVAIDVASTLAGQFEVLPAAAAGSTATPPFTPGHNPAAVVSPPAGHTSLHAIIKSVVGPVTSDSLSKTPAGALGTFAVVTVLSVSALGATGAAALNARPASGTIQTYALPVDAAPNSITAGPNGNVWFVEKSQTLAEMTPNGTVTTFTLPLVPGSIPIAGPDGNLWTLGTSPQGSDFEFLRITPDGSASRVLSVSLNPGVEAELAAASDGNIWYLSAGSGGSSLQSISPAGKPLRQVQISKPNPADFPVHLTAGAAGSLWFTLDDFGARSGNSVIGYMMLATGKVKEFAVPGANHLASTNPPVGSIARGPDGNLWFTMPNANKIGRATPTGSVTEFALPTARSEPLGIAAGPDGNLWFTEAGASAIGRMTTSGVVHEFPLVGLRGASITRGADGNMWFVCADATNVNTYRIGRISP